MKFQSFIRERSIGDRVRQSKRIGCPEAISASKAAIRFDVRPTGSIRSYSSHPLNSQPSWSQPCTVTERCTTVHRRRPPSATPLTQSHRNHRESLRVRLSATMCIRPQSDELPRGLNRTQQPQVHHRIWIIVTELFDLISDFATLLLTEFRFKCARPTCGRLAPPVRWPVADDNDELRVYIYWI